jgi:hypothetical protein
MRILFSMAAIVTGGLSPSVRLPRAALSPFVLETTQAMRASGNTVRIRSHDHASRVRQSDKRGSCKRREFRRVVHSVRLLCQS